jgi:Ca2+-binding EF-hand superfamily protein
LFENNSDQLEEAKEAFKVFDINRSGTISGAELKQVLIDQILCRP